MSVSAFLDWPDDDDDPDDDPDDPDDDGDEFGSGFDERDCAPPGELHVELAFDDARGQLACVYTLGLWESGIPELFISPPPSFKLDDDFHQAEFAVLLATGLIKLGQELIQAENFDIPSQQAELVGRKATFWLGPAQPPSGRLAIALGSEIDTVIRVDCSLWHAPLLGDGQAGD